MPVCCRNIRLYDFVTRKAFYDLVQHLVLHHSTTVSRLVKRRAQALQESMVTEIETITESYGCASKVNIWTKAYHKTSLLSSIIYYTNNEDVMIDDPAP